MQSLTSYHYKADTLSKKITFIYQNSNKRNKSKM